MNIPELTKSNTVKRRQFHVFLTQEEFAILTQIAKENHLTKVEVMRQLFHIGIESFNK